jgi:hypothetical protein
MGRGGGGGGFTFWGQRWGRVGVANLTVADELVKGDQPAKHRINTGKELRVKLLTVLELA